MRMQIALLSLFCLVAPTFAQSPSGAPPDKTSRDAQLDELRTAPVPKQAMEIDTLQLASAHRERAASVDEKTNGLWQSWTTSICDGCSNTPSYEKTIRDDFTNRKAVTNVSGGTASPNQKQTAQPRSFTAQPAHSLYTDLSTENIYQIRKMPER